MAPWALLSPGVLVRTGHTVLTWGITLVLFLHDTGLCSARDRLATFSYIPLHRGGMFSCSPPAPASLSFSGLSSAAAVGRAGGAAPAPYLPAPRAGLPAALPGRVAHGPGLCECPAPAPGRGPGGADGHGSSSHPPSALQTLPGAGRPPRLRPSLLTSSLPSGEPALSPPPPCPQQPLRARHCRDCRRCVRRFDHHCPWMENCVGERNHPLFVAYLALQLVVLLWGLYLAWSGLHFSQPWGLWLRSSGLLFATFLLLSLFSLATSLLLASHLYLVASNTTTWEFISSHRIAYLRQRPSNPFDRGLTRNLTHFFCGWPSWETLWAEGEDEEEEGRSQAV
ncbi:palmitoyltransferase ZDHHC12 isoform X2 [Mirounga angustirostris]|uniref:palmitoyltransferase ZDHHC12 isoform X2 n=1 Tax=Mirounga angustirostris TaxID=9716 RepID=UPI00313AF5C7